MTLELWKIFKADYQDKENFKNLHLKIKNKTIKSMET